MNITTLMKVHYENAAENSNNVSLIATKALIFVVENHFKKLASSFVLTFMCQEIFFCNYYNDLLDKLFETWNAPPLQIVRLSSKRKQYVPGVRDLNLILIDSFESLRAIDVISYTANYDHNEYYYIFLQNFDKTLNIEMLKIFQYCWENYIINCNVQIQNHKKEILIYTYYPFSSGNCNKVKLKLINQFKNGTLVNEILFPRKLMNFFGCPLRAAIWNVPPFVYLEEFNNASGIIKHGAEGRLITELAEKLNFTILVKVPPNDERRGSADINNLTGAMHMLHERTADLSLGFMRFTLERSKIATPTWNYYQSELIVCAPIAGYYYTSSEILLYPFTLSTWAVFAALWFVAIPLIWLAKKYRHLYAEIFSNHMLQRTYQNMLLMTLGMPATVMPKHIYARLLCVNWIIFMLILRTAYQALFFHMIRTQPTNGMPTTFYELYVNNYTTVLNRATYVALKDVTFTSRIKFYVLNDTKETIAFEYVEKHPHKRLVAAGPSAFFSYYKDNLKKVDVFRKLNQNIYIMQISMYFPKHSYLVDQFNEVILNFRSTGLTQAWIQMELDFEYLNNYESREMRYFTLKDLYMIFAILILGYIIATISFLVELCYSKKIAYGMRKKT